MRQGEYAEAINCQKQTLLILHKVEVFLFQP